MSVFFESPGIALHLGDCLDVLRTIPDGSTDAVVTDPPYGLKFKNKRWDTSVPSVEVWEEVLRVLKPGGYLLSFGGTRTYHRMVVAIEDAGFEIRDQLAWLFGSGFPKSLNLVGEWQGWGTALKPAHEPIVLARKPFAGTVAANVLEHGTGALNIDGCRIGYRESRPLQRKASIGYGGSAPQGYVDDGGAGRWPANVLLDEAAAEMLDEQSGILTSGDPGDSIIGPDKNRNAYGAFGGNVPLTGYGDSGGASRFFYVAKASRKERDAGLGTAARQNHHPTVKPVDLMRYLVRLVTPPGGVVLDPYTGSGTTGVAAALEGFRFVGIELSPEYVEIARQRIVNTPLPLL